MCTQVNHYYTCGHRAFKRFDNCPRFGQGCFGPGGSNHKDEGVDCACRDCKVREDLREYASRSREQSQQAGEGGTPGSSGGTSVVGAESNGKVGGEEEEEGDPWWEGDPWRKYRTG